MVKIRTSYQKKFKYRMLSMNITSYLGVDIINKHNMCYW
jgi:hypothetical protein